MSGDKNTEQPEKFRFRIVHLMYVVAMLSSSMALFGYLGLIPGLIICLVWFHLLFNKFTKLEVIALSLLIFILGTLSLPSVTMIKYPSTSSRICSSNLNQLGVAIQTYHSEYNSFPPAFIADEDGNPMHSWRVLLLPYLGEDALYDQYDFNEPWNGPSNSRLFNKMPPVYSCPCIITPNPTKNFDSPNYFAVIGDKTVWPKDKFRKFSEISAGLDNTILFTESSELVIPWTEPKDLTENQALLLFSNTDSSQLPHSLGRHVVLCDSSVRLGYQNLTKKSWSSWFQIDRPYFVEEQPEIPKKQNRYAVALQVYLFVTLLLLPMPWVKGKYKE